MFYADKRFIYLMLIVIVLMNLMSMNQLEWLALILTVPGVLIAISFNPFTHVDPIGFVMLLFVGFGWGRPVEINPRNFDRKYSQTAGEAIVSAAGPIMNFILAIVFTLIYCALYKFAYGFVVSQVGSIIFSMIQYTIVMNIGLGIFNLIPLPPLDGSKILVNFLPYRGRQWVYEHEQIFYIVFLVIWITGIAGHIISPALNLMYSGLIQLGLKIFGI